MSRASRVYPQRIPSYFTFAQSLKKKITDKHHKREERYNEEPKPVIVVTTAPAKLDAKLRNAPLTGLEMHFWTNNSMVI